MPDVGATHAARIKIGDLAQWTSGGVDQFTTPQRIVWVSDDGLYARVSSSQTGIPIAELTIVVIGDSITVLHSVHKKHAAKQFTFIPGKKGNPDKIQNKSYGKESHFRVEQIPVIDFAELNAALERLDADPFAFIIRDEPLPHTNLNHTRRWARPHGNEPATFAPTPRQWLPIDLDHIAAPALTDVVTDPEAAIEYLIGLLPKELHDVTCRWQLTSSQGLPGSEHLLSARLYYWLSEAQNNDALKRWAAAANTSAGFKAIDPVLYHPIQAIYTAAPLFRNMPDPLPRRGGVRDGLDDTACLIIPPADKQHPDQISGEGYEPGYGVEAYIAQIGKPHFREPLVKAIASYIAIYGASADTEPVKRAIRQAFRAIDPDWTQNDKLSRYGSDAHLDDIITAIRAFQGDKPGQGWTQPPPDYFDEPPPLDPDPEQFSTVFQLPPLIGLRVAWRCTETDEIWLYRLKGIREDKQTGEREEIWEAVSSPFGNFVLLLTAGGHMTHGLRVHVRTATGAVDTVDFMRAELPKLGASGVRSAMMSAGVRLANGGENTIVEILKQIQPGEFIQVIAAFGRNQTGSGNVFLTPGGKSAKGYWQ
jgi:hypothetical protein